MSAQIINYRIDGEQGWVRSAECAKPGGPTMFPHDKDNIGIQVARDVCNRCPVRTQCLEEALNRKELFGVWGGLTTDERQGLRRLARAAARRRK
jgi:WhiB family redox-sensing transcriptional regulator